MEWTVLSCVKKETFPSPPLSDTICPAAPSIWMKGGIPCKPPSPGSCGLKTPWRNMKRRCCACAARCWATPRWRRTPCRIPSSAHGRALPHFRGDSSEKTWLTHIAVNVCRDLQRKGWFRHEDRRVSLDTLPEPAAPCTAQQDALARAVLCLPLPCRQAVLLRYYQQMTLPEAAQALGISLSTMNRRLRRAETLLKKELEEG